MAKLHASQIRPAKRRCHLDGGEKNKAPVYRCPASKPSTCHQQDHPSPSLYNDFTMRRNIQLLATALPLATAWPMVMEEVAKTKSLPKRDTQPTVPPPKFNSGRDNCGFHGPCTTFDEKDQFVDVRPGSGHEWTAPGPSDIRGQCPGLNAAANHGFLPHSGVVNTQQSMYRALQS